MNHESSTTRTALVLIRDLIGQRLGMRFEDNQLDILMDKISPLVTDKGFDALLDYYYLLKYDATEPAEWKRVMDAISVRESFFWRELDQVRALVDIILPAWAEHRQLEPLRIWCAACAGGEEPISIAIALKEAGWFDRIPIEICGTDASSRSVGMAEAGVYRERSFRVLPEEIRSKYFREYQGAWKVVADIHRRIRWSVANLAMAADIERFASVRIIFCRNVFIYFSENAIRQTVRAFYERMRTPGYLFVGVAESLLKTNTDFQLRQIGGAFVYVKEGNDRSALNG